MKGTPTLNDIVGVVARATKTSASVTLTIAQDTHGDFGTVTVHKAPPVVVGNLVEAFSKTGFPQVADGGLVITFTQEG